MKVTKLNDYEILTPDGYKDFDGVAQLPKQRLLKFTLDDGRQLLANFNHTFVILGSEVKATQLIEGEVLETVTGLKTITKIDLVNGTDYVYDILDVKSSGNTYYANNIVSHNCKFIGSSNTLIEGEVLERIETCDPIKTKWNGVFEIWEEPQEGAMYMLGVDPSEGTGNDNSCVQVLKINSEFIITQVAVYRNSMIEPYNFAQICISISEYYNGCYMMVENNNVGQIVADAIWWDFEYDKIINCDKKGIGIRSTRKTKLAANLLVKRYLEHGWLEIFDRKTVYELSLYQEVSPNVFKAGKYEHDDHVTSLIWGIYFLSTVHFDGKNTDVKVIDEKFRLDTKEEEESLGITIIDDQLDIEDADSFWEGIDHVQV